MSYEVFESLILAIQDLHKRERAFSEAITIVAESSFVVCSFADELLKAIDKLFVSAFGKEGEELIGWWLYDGSDKKLYINETEERSVETIEELYAYLIEQK